MRVRKPEVVSYEGGGSGKPLPANEPGCGCAFSLRNGPSEPKISRKVWTAFAVTPGSPAALDGAMPTQLALSLAAAPALPAPMSRAAPTLAASVDVNRLIAPSSCPFAGLVGVRWAARTLIAKPGMDQVDAKEIEPIFCIALNWGTYRVLTEVAGLSVDEYEAWLAGYYRRMLLAG
jgi:hypothetical protein